MEARVCPNCGKHNPRNAWSCADCGETLSIDTLINEGNGLPIRAKAIAGYTALSDISEHFEPDVDATLNQLMRIDDAVVGGCNFARISKIPPYYFGYLVITERALIRVQFESDTSTNIEDLGKDLVLGRPLRNFPFEDLSVVSDRYKVSTRPWKAVELDHIAYPGQPLTQTELKSRQVILKDLHDLLTVRCVNQWFNNNLIKSLVVHFSGEDEEAITFYSPHLAEKAEQILSGYVQTAALFSRPLTLRRGAQLPENSPRKRPDMNMSINRDLHRDKKGRIMFRVFLPALITMGAFSLIARTALRIVFGLWDEFGGNIGDCWGQAWSICGSVGGNCVAEAHWDCVDSLAVSFGLPVIIIVGLFVGLISYARSTAIVND